MAKTIKNKQYSEFWEDENLNIEKSDKKTDSTVTSEEIKKLEKKLNKKVSGLEKEIKELKEEPKIEEEIEPVNKPRGWHAKNEFIDDVGNVFSKGKFVAQKDNNVDKKPTENEPQTEINEPQIIEKEYVEKAKKNIESLSKEKIEGISDKIIPDISVKSDERKMVMPKNIPKVITEIEPIISPKPPKALTQKDIYQQYINDKNPFKMFFRGNLIFDSKIQPPKNYPKFNDDGFILFGKNYIYRGIRIEKY